MTINIGPEDQKEVDRLRISLSQVSIDMTEVYTHDPNSNDKKTSVLMQLSEIKKIMDRIGLTHTMAGKIDNVRTREAVVNYFEARV